ncbi:type VII secretion protein EccE [Mycolicibacterium brumae]|uniref:Type VII secretion protein EccE n=2 Tax=Mycolicibacterium brumae TaxID=85968 RepID=A0A2G5PFL6_9MYCO|nr:type VII secretion protein EccE [Mycolicibacterium brumae]PIB77105.1 type VII secretion protein EccE [Mycolicibacterium brumae]
MSMRRPTMVWPGTARISLVALFAAPAAMAYPWHTLTQRWVLGVAIAVALVLLPWWRGEHLTTMAARRLGMVTRRGGEGAHEVIDHAPTEARTTAVLQVRADDDEEAQELPLTLIADYLDRYGVQCESVRIASRDTPARRSTFVSLTMAAGPNLAALRARSSNLPLRRTAEAAARRLADHLRELGWDAVMVTGGLDVPELLGPQAKEGWRTVTDGSSGFVSGYAVKVDDELSDVLAELWALDSPEIWTVAEISADGLAVGAAIRSEDKPDPAGPLAGLTAVRGRQRAALDALHPMSTERLLGRSGSAGLLGELSWPASDDEPARV